MKVLALVGVVTVSALGAFAQNVVSARAGMIHHVEGAVELDGAEVAIGKNHFPAMKNGQTLATAAGRAEVLLSTGVFLRLGENSSVKMVDNSLNDTRVELAGESALVEVIELIEGSSLTVLAGGSQVTPKKPGVYRFGGSPMELRVYDGQAEVRAGGKVTVAKRSAVVSLESGLMAGKFDSKDRDSFQRWSARRSGYVAAANISAAKMIYDDPLSYSFRSGWVWNPWFGMFTYIPYSGVLTSPFGFHYYTPRRVYMAYAPPPQISAPGWGESGMSRVPTYNPSLGYSTVGARSAAGAPSSAAPSAAPSVSAPSGRGGENGGARGPSSAGGRTQ